MMNAMHRPDTSDGRSLLLKKIADELLSAQADDDGLSRAAAELYSLCSAVAGIDERSERADESAGAGLPTGEAISPRDAARCVLDYRRTSKFLRGLHAAVLDARKRFPGGVIEILYAGCGPFAALALPLTSRFGAAEVKFTLLDVHERSLDAARRIFRALGKGAFVRDYIQRDAASYKHDAPHAVHVVVVEAMQAALEREPQVAITMNLAPQLCPGGIFLPDRITVDCHLCDLTKEFPASPADSLSAGGRVRAKLGRVLELSAGSCREPSSPGGGRRPAALAPKLLNVPEGSGGGHLMLSTSINVFDSIALGDYESGLTCPKILYDLGEVRGGRVIEFEYYVGERPGFRYRSL